MDLILQLIQEPSIQSFGAVVVLIVAAAIAWSIIKYMVKMTWKVFVSGCVGILALATCGGGALYVLLTQLQ